MSFSIKQNQIIEFNDLTCRPRGVDYDNHEGVYNFLKNIIKILSNANILNYRSKFL